MKKIPIHSVTSLITNSSTTIYTYSNGTIEPFKNLINEMFRLSGINKVCDDVFELKITTEDCEEEIWDEVLDYIYEEKKSEFFTQKGELDEDKLHEFIDGVNNGKLEKPCWLQEIEDDMINGDYTLESYLEIKAKDPEYENLAELAIKFLYSTTHDGFYNG